MASPYANPVSATLTAATTGAAIGISAAAGAAAGSVVPVIGTAIGAMVGALAGWFSDLASGVGQGPVAPFDPTKAQAGAYLLLFTIAPDLIYAGHGIAGMEGKFGGMPYMLDAPTAAYYATQLFGTAGITPSGQLIDPTFLGQVLALGKSTHGANPSAPLATTPAEASALLQMLRAYPADALQSAITNAVTEPAYHTALARNVQALRRMAGESGPDPALAAIIGEDVTVLAGAGSSIGDGGLLNDCAMNSDGSGTLDCPPGVLPGGATSVSQGQPLPVGYSWSPGGIQGPAGFTTFTAGTIRPAASPATPAASSTATASWWGVAVVVAAAAALGGAVVWRTRAHQRLNSLGTQEQLLSPGDAAFQRVIREGVSDGELAYSRDMRGLGRFNKTFSDARLLGMSPTELALSGRYFGEEVVPIRIEVYPTGDMRLSDGRLCYTAAKMAGARAILADVVQFDGQGDEVRAWRAAVTLL